LPADVILGIIDRKCCIFTLGRGANTNGNSCYDDEEPSHGVGGIAV
jgi:hypothetical protein